jgi:hypothetical protein
MRGKLSAAVIIPLLLRPHTKLFEASEGVGGAGHHHHRPRRCAIVSGSASAIASAVKRRKRLQVPELPVPRVLEHHAGPLEAEPV